MFNKQKLQPQSPMPFSLFHPNLLTIPPEKSSLNKVVKSGRNHTQLTNEMRGNH